MLPPPTTDSDFDFGRGPRASEWGGGRGSIEPCILKPEDRMEQIDREEERRAAEDFRRQLQERSLGDSPHPSAAEQFRWLNENDKLLERIARVNWGSASGEGLTPAQFKEELATVPLPSPHDEPFTHSIVHQLSQQIEGVCQEWRIPLRSGVAYGSNPILDVASPFQVGVPLTDASVISLSTGFRSENRRARAT